MSPSARRATAESVNVIGHDVRLSGVGPVATLTLRRPTASVPGRPGPPIADVPAGPLPAADLLEMLYAFERDLTGDVQVVVIDGDTSAFAAGLGPELGPGGAAGTSPLGTSDQISQAQETVSWLRRPDLVSIAVVRGPVRGVGLQVVLACDLRVLARDDAQLVLDETRLGVVPCLGGTKRLVEIIGYSRALELCITGRTVSASEAGLLGLANAVVPGEGLDECVAALARAILAMSRDATVELKALLTAATQRTAEQQEAAELAAFVRLSESPEDRSEEHEYPSGESTLHGG